MKHFYWHESEQNLFSVMPHSTDICLNTRGLQFGIVMILVHLEMREKLLQIFKN